MQNPRTVGLSQPRGPVFDVLVRANYQLGRRMAQRSSIKTSEADGRLARGLGEKLGRNGAPSDRMVRQWVQELPDYPERMVRAGMISNSDILPELRPFLDSGTNADLTQAPAAGSSFNTRQPEPQREVGGINAESWLTSLLELGVFLGGIILACKVLEALLPAHQGWRNPGNPSWQGQGSIQTNSRSDMGNSGYNWQQ